MILHPKSIVITLQKLLLPPQKNNATLQMQCGNN